jgi:hypothetical protein
MPDADPLRTWLPAVIARHTAALSTPEFLKAVRALSARYVERRAELGRRSPIDSAGKRAAFAAFFAPLHFVTTREIVAAFGEGMSVRRIVDLGCGTGTASAAWALRCEPPPEIQGIDREGWSLAEAAWNWRQLGLRGRTRRGDLVQAARQLRGAGPAGGTGILLAWSVNEIDDDARAALLPSLLELGRRGATVLVIEPLARAAVPWWETWAAAFAEAGGHADEWKIAATLPAPLNELSEAAGFRRHSLGARTLRIGGRG